MSQRPVLLLIEDNAGDAGLATEAAAWLGIDADIAWVSDGVEALSWLRQREGDRAGCPRLIVLDLNLPRMGGHEFLDRLRDGDASPDAPVVVLSSSSRAEDRERALRRGVLRYLTKPRMWDAYVDAFRAVADEWRAAG